MPERLTDEELDARLRDGAWRREADAIVRDLSFADFAAAIAFVNRVAQRAQEANHHPDITVHGYRHVRLRLSTHSVGGVTTADFDLARALDAAVEG